MSESEYKEAIRIIRTISMDLINLVSEFRLDESVIRPQLAGLSILQDMITDAYIDDDHMSA